MSTFKQLSTFRSRVEDVAERLHHRIGQHLKDRFDSIEIAGLVHQGAYYYNQVEEDASLGKAASIELKKLQARLEPILLRLQTRLTCG